jgi:hypothetical protein
MLKLLAGCEKYAAEIRSTGYRNAQRLKALVLLMRYTGMRIGGAVNLSAERVEDDKPFSLYSKNWNGRLQRLAGVCCHGTSLPHPDCARLGDASLAGVSRRAHRSSPRR